VAVLAAVALPAYNDYTLKSRISQLMAAANQSKGAISEAAQAIEALSAMDSITGPPAVGYISAFSISASGVITVAGKEAAGTAGFGEVVTLTLTPSWNNTSKNVRWSCAVTPVRLEPSNCKVD
jgi:type IV pilus assembly protein PilA